MCIIIYSILKHEMTGGRTKETVSIEYFRCGKIRIIILYFIVKMSSAVQYWILLWNESKGKNFGDTK